MTAENRPTSPAPHDPTAQLARKVAHELNSPLDGVMRFVALAQRKVREKHYDDIERYLADAEFGLQRMAEILRDLTDVHSHAPTAPTSTAARPPLRPIPLDQLLAHAIQTLAATAELRGVTLQLDPSPSPSPSVDAHLYQVLCNLLKNAIEATPPGGLVTIHTSLTSPSPLLIRILDTGTGVAPQHQPHLFEPFFTTKPRGQGMGLGLTLCRDILTKLGGTITLTNRPDSAGCEARIELPISR